MTTMTPLTWLLWAGLLIAAITDLQTRKIRNKLVGTLIVVGFAYNVLMPDGLGWQPALIGFVAATALHFSLFFLGLEGAGDGKLMIAVGTCLGWQLMVEATFWRYFLLLPYAVVAITVTKRWGNFRAALQWTLHKASGQPVGERPEPLLLPFGPVVAVSVVLAQTTTWLNAVLGF